MIGEIGKYLLAGLCAASGQYITLIGLTEGFDVDPVYSSAIGYVVAATISYILNYKFTFRSTRSHSQAVPTYVLVVTIGFLINFASMALFVQSIGLHYLLSQIVTTVFVVIWQYVGHKVWTFRSD